MLETLIGREKARVLEFSKAVESAKGYAIVLVHPSYPGWDYNATGISEEKLEKLVTTGRRRRSIPLIVLESAERLKKFKEWVETIELGEEVRRIMCITANANNPHPLKGDWNSLAKQIAEEGVKRIFVCGRLLETSNRNADFSAIIDAAEARAEEHGGNANCVRQAIERFKESELEAEALERSQFERIWRTREEKHKAQGRRGEEIDEAKRQFHARIGYARASAKCVGEAYKELLRTRKFELVRVAVRHCR